MYQKLCLFFKLKRNKHSSYLLDIILKDLSTRSTRNHNTFIHLMLNMYTSETLFFHPLLLSRIISIIIFEIRNRLVLKKQFLKFIGPSPNSKFNVHNSHGIKLLTGLRVGQTHLRKHRFRYNFQDPLDPFCNCRRKKQPPEVFYKKRCS